MGVVSAEETGNNAVRGVTGPSATVPPAEKSWAGVVLATKTGNSVSGVTGPIANHSSYEELGGGGVSIVKWKRMLPMMSQVPKPLPHKL